MYCEYLLQQIVENQNKELIAEFFIANYGLVYSFEKAFGVPEVEKEDFRQLSFVAFSDAAKYYKPNTKNSFLSYWRRCMLHEYYLYKLNTRYPLSIPRSAYQEFKNDGIAAAEAVYQRYCTATTYYQVDDTLTQIENECCSKTLWSIVEDTVGDFGSAILKEHFICNKTLAVISEELHCSATTITTEYNKAIRRLRKNKRLRSLASDMYGI